MLRKNHNGSGMGKGAQMKCIDQKSGNLLFLQIGEQRGKRKRQGRARRILLPLRAGKVKQAEQKAVRLSPI